MTLVEAIIKIAREFPSAKNQDFKGHPLAALIRHDWKTLAEASLIGEPTGLAVSSSAGKGRWSDFPWLAYLDSSVTNSAQSGYYPVFLFEPDMQSFCLVLGQGAEAVESCFGAKRALQVVAERAEILRNAAGEWESAGFSVGPFETRRRIQTSEMSGSDPWSSSVAFGKRYLVKSPPTDAQLQTDIRKMLKLYRKVVDVVGTSFTDEDETVVDLDNSGELPLTAGLDGAIRISEHKKFEQRIRNRKLVKEAKKFHGYRCQGCQISLAVAYPEYGKDFVEAHHLNPLALAPSEGALLTAQDFAILCPTCHRAIHRMGCPRLEEFVASIPEPLRAMHLSLDKET